MWLQIRNVVLGKNWLDDIKVKEKRSHLTFDGFDERKRHFIEYYS